MSRLPVFQFSWFDPTFSLLHYVCKFNVSGRNLYNILEDGILIYSFTVTSNFGTTSKTTSEKGISFCCLFHFLCKISHFLVVFMIKASITLKLQKRVLRGVEMFPEWLLIRLNWKNFLGALFQPRFGGTDQQHFVAKISFANNSFRAEFSPMSLMFFLISNIAFQKLIG